MIRAWLEKKSHAIVREDAVSGAVILCMTFLFVTGLIVTAIIFDPVARTIAGVIALVCSGLTLVYAAIRWVILRFAAVHEAKRRLLNEAKVDDHYNSGWGEP
jgi:hypothetical protein